jgi:hypothetical protein
MGECSTYGEMRGSYCVLVRKPKGKRKLGRSRRRWGDNIEMDFQELGCGVWTESIWLRIGIVDGHLQL